MVDRSCAYCALAEPRTVVCGEIYDFKCTLSPVKGKKTRFDCCRRFEPTTVNEKCNHDSRWRFVGIYDIEKCKKCGSVMLARED